jgi:hypothetical protein
MLHPCRATAAEPPAPPPCLAAAPPVSGNPRGNSDLGLASCCGGTHPPRLPVLRGGDRRPWAARSLESVGSGRALHGAA